MNVRVLSHGEYKLLDQIPKELLSDPDPARTIAIAALEGDELLGCAFLVVLPHIEGIWVKPEHQKGIVAKRIEEVLVEHSKRVLGIDRIFAYAFTDQIASYLERVGYKRIPVTLYEKEAV